MPKRSDDAEEKPKALTTYTIKLDDAQMEKLRAVVAACPQLQAFSISSDQQAAGLASVGDAFVTELVQCCPCITALELSDTSVRWQGAARGFW